MAIKLYNKSQCPDEILRPIIAAAGRRIGARTGVVVKVLGPCRGHQGHAKHQFRVYSWHLTQKRTKRLGRSIATDGGWIELHVPRRHPADNHLMLAEQFYRLCLHEWGHIKDFQDGKRFGDYDKRWANRPHERRAIRMEYEAQEIPMSPTAEKAVLALGLWLESDGAQ